MKLVPLTDRVVLKQLEAEETTASGIVLPGAAQEKPQEAEVKAEFKKIIWPEQKSVVRQTIAVIVTSVVVGLIIALLDWAIQHGVNFLVGLKF